MNRSANPYERHRFPPAVIQYGVWLYDRYSLSHRDIEDLLVERGIEATRAPSSKVRRHILHR
jgi:putative transposase